jgi:hypothetical protein
VQYTHLLDKTVITETNRIHLALFGMQNRTFGPYLAAINRILISVVTEHAGRCACITCAASRSSFRTEHLVSHKQDPCTTCAASRSSLSCSAACFLAHDMMLVSGLDVRPRPRMRIEPPRNRYLEDQPAPILDAVGPNLVRRAGDSDPIWPRYVEFLVQYCTSSVNAACISGIPLAQVAGHRKVPAERTRKPGSH